MIIVIVHLGRYSRFYFPCFFLYEGRADFQWFNKFKQCLILNHAMTIVLVEFLQNVYFFR